MKHRKYQNCCGGFTEHADTCRDRFKVDPAGPRDKAYDKEPEYTNTLSPAGCITPEFVEMQRAENRRLNEALDSMKPNRALAPCCMCRKTDWSYSPGTQSYLCKNCGIVVSAKNLGTVGLPEKPLTKEVKENPGRPGVVELFFFLQEHETRSSIEWGRESEMGDICNYMSSLEAKVELQDKVITTLPDEYHTGCFKHKDEPIDMTALAGWEFVEIDDAVGLIFRLKNGSKQRLLSGHWTSRIIMSGRIFDPKKSWREVSDEQD